MITKRAKGDCLLLKGGPSDGHLGRPALSTFDAWPPPKEIVVEGHCYVQTFAPTTAPEDLSPGAVRQAIYAFKGNA